MISSLTFQDLLWRSKLFEISEEFTKFKLQQKLKITFIKNDKVFKNKLFADPFWVSTTR